MTGRRSGAIALVLLAATAATGVAQERRVVRGRVIDAGSGTPLGGARVRSAVGADIVHTTEAGEFRVAVDRSAPDTLVVTRIGFSPRRLAIADDALSLTVPMTPLAVVLHDLVTVATRRDTRAADVVVPVTVVTRRDAERAGAASLDRLLDRVPGLQQASAPPASSSIMVRGISGSRVLVLVDGEPAPGRQLEDRDLGRISTAHAERVEVVKGPLAVMHGSQALGGVVNVVSRAPQGPLAFDIEAGAGSHGRRSGSVAAQRGGTLAWRADGSVREEDQLGGQVARAGTFARTWDGRVDLRHEAPGRTTVRFHGSWFRERQRWPTGAGLFGFNDNRGITGWSELTTPLAAGTARARLTVQDFSHRFREAANEVPYEGTGAPAQRERTVRAQLSHAVTIAQHRIDAGLDASSASVVAVDRLRGERLRERTAAIFAQDAITFGPALLTLGLRHSLGERWGGATTPSLGLAIEPLASVRVRAGAARGFRSPSFKELGWNFVNPAAGYVIEGNDSLRAEHGWQGFAGATWAPVAGFTVDIEIFRNALRDMIETGYVGTNDAGLAIYSPRNLASVRTQGLDIALRGSWAGTDVSLDHAWLGTHDATRGGVLGQRPAHTTRVNASRQLGAVAVSAAARRVSAAPIIDAAGTTIGVQSALVTVDASVDVAPWRSVRVVAGITNLLDARPTGWQAPIRRAAWVSLRSSITP